MKRIIGFLRPKVIPFLTTFLNLALIGVGVTGVLSLYNLVPTGSSLNPVTNEEVLANSEILSGFADISGQVIKPGSYQITKGQRLSDLVEMAGGFTNEIDLSFVNKCLNLSSLLNDQQKIYLPANNEKFSCGNNTSQDSVANKININTASQSEIESLPGIGATIAQRIIEARPFSSIEDLRNVKGVGESLFEKIKNNVSL